MNTKYMIINMTDDDIMYMVYNKGNRTDFTDPYDGYFWTWWSEVKDLVDQDTAEHPFTFESRDEAKKYALKLGLKSFDTKPVEVEFSKK